MDYGPWTKKLKMRNYKKIEAWISASDLAMAIYMKTGMFPKEEKYGLISQIRRAAISVLASIAEGASRQHNKEYLQLLYVARGSLAEVEVLLEISARLSFLKEPHFKELNSLFQKTARCLFGLIRAVASDVHSPWSIVHSPSNKEEEHV